MASPEQPLPRVQEKPKAPQELVEPVKGLVRVALGLVRTEGERELEDERTRVVLQNGNSLFEIAYYSEPPKAGLITRTHGMFVSEITLDEGNNPVSLGPILQLPTHELSVTQKKLYILRHVPPEQIKTLSEKLQDGTKVPNKQYDTAHSQLIKKSQAVA